MLVVMWFLFALIYLNISFTKFSLDFFLDAGVHVYLAHYLDKMKDDTFLFFFRHLCIYTCTLNQLKNIITINQLILRVGLYILRFVRNRDTLCRGAYCKDYVDFIIFPGFLAFLNDYSWPFIVIYLLMNSQGNSVSS